jgi:hypothetical protein
MKQKDDSYQRINRMWEIKAQEEAEMTGHNNDRLTSAAPNLLEALLVALPFVEDHEDCKAYKAGAVAKAVKQIRAAIDKATQ